MNVVELEKIIEQLKKYDLLEEINNIEVWLSKLNARKIKNLISLNIELSEFLKQKKNKWRLLYLLNSKYYVQDITLINNATNISNQRIFYLFDIAGNSDSRESEFHESDMKLIKNAKSDAIAEYLRDIAWNAKSLVSGYHEKDMELTANAESEILAECLKDVIWITQHSVTYELYHESDMELILQSKELVYSQKELGNSTSQIVEQILNKKYNERKETIKDEISLNNVEIVEQILKNANRYVNGNNEQELPTEVLRLERKN